MYGNVHKSMRYPFVTGIVTVLGRDAILIKTDDENRKLALAGTAVG
jgi:hypothetical protein